MPSNVLVIAPHPDDESIGCGGSICLHRRRGDAVRVVFLTSCERGIDGIPPETARSVRKVEAAQALGVLGVERMDFLRLPDLSLSAAVERAAGRLREVLGEGLHVAQEQALRRHDPAIAPSPPGSAICCHRDR